jgi:hypothetical protein
MGVKGVYSKLRKVGNKFCIYNYMPIIISERTRNIKFDQLWEAFLGEPIELEGPG